MAKYKPLIVGGRKDHLRYHPDPNYAGTIIESGSATGYSGLATVSATKTMACVIPLSKANGVRTITHVHVYCRAASTGRMNVYLYAVAGDEESPIPTGNWGSKTGALDEFVTPATVTAVWNDITLTGGDYVPATGSQLALVFENGTGGTSFQIGANAGQVMSGVRSMWAATIATEIQDTVWEQFDSIIPGIEIQYSDGAREAFHVSFGANSAGNVPIHSDPASGGVAGIGIQPDEDVPCNVIEAFLSTSGTTTSAGIVCARIYKQTDLVNPWLASVNSYDTSTSCLSSSERRLKDFFFEDFTFERGVKHYATIEQVTNGGSASHHVLLGGGTSTLYVTGAQPPRTFDENNYHGLHSVSSITGRANLASNVVTGHYMRIRRRPLTRTSTIFS